MFFEKVRSAVRAGGQFEAFVRSFPQRRRGDVEGGREGVAEGAASGHGTLP